MPIVVACECGKQLRVQDGLLGKRVQCPECRRLLTAQAPPPAPPPVVPPAPVQVSMGPALQGWHFVSIEGQRQGPVSLTELQVWIDEGKLTPANMVWNHHLPNWVPAGQLPELFPAPPPLPAGVRQVIQVPTSAVSNRTSAASEIAHLRQQIARIEADESVPRQPPTFGSWYQAKFGGMPTLLHIPMWFLYGFLWIPILYFLSGDPNSPFGRWYRNRFGGIINLPMPLSVLVQLSLWGMYGFVWIPILYWVTGPDKSDAQTSERIKPLLERLRQLEPAAPEVARLPAATGKSAWYLWAFMPYLNGAAWLHAGLRTGYPWYYILAVFYSIPFAIYIFMHDRNADSGVDHTPDWVITLVMLSWLLGIVHVFWKNLEVNLRIKHAATSDGETDETLDRRIAAEYAQRRAALSREVSASQHRTLDSSAPLAVREQKEGKEDADKSWGDIVRFYLNKPIDYWIKRIVLAAVFGVGAKMLQYGLNLAMSKMFS